jgi:hypothetical protein
MRQTAPNANTVAAELDAGKRGLDAVPRDATGKDGAASPVEFWNVHGGAERDAAEFSPGKASLDLRDGEVSSVASEINGNWRRGVAAFMNIARLCAEASGRLTTAQKSELMTCLPFGEATFSKFVKIGTDTRLNTPEIQLLLPPHYTTIYAVTQLTNQELSLAIADKVVHPDMKREELRRWHRELQRIGVGPNPHVVASDSAVDNNQSIDSKQDAAESGVPSALGPREIEDKVATVQDELAVSPEGAAEKSKHLENEVGNDQSIIPDASADKSTSCADGDGGFERLKARWEKYIAPDWKDAPDETRARFIMEVLDYSALTIGKGDRPKQELQN